jgi:hypothetical protein
VRAERMPKADFADDKTVPDYGLVERVTCSTILRASETAFEMVET